MSEPCAPASRSWRATLVLIVAGALCFSVTIGGVLWWYLPQWAPTWVMRHSPWVMPAFRASLADNNRSAFLQRLPDWGEALIAPMEDVLRYSTDRNERWRALDALMVLNHPRTVPAFILALSDPDPDHIEFAAYQLGKLNDPSAFEPLIAALRRLPPTVVAGTAFDLAAIDHPAKFEFISARLLAAPEGWLQGAGCIALGSCADDRTLPTLLAHLGRHQDSYLLDDAGYALGGMTSPAATTAIVQALADVDERRRYGAIIATRTHASESPTVREQLLAILLPLTNDPVMRVRLAAVESLIYYRDDRARTRLATVVHDGGAPALAALASMCATEDDAYRLMVLGALDHAEAAVRRKALACLPELGPPARHYQRILRLVDDPDPEVAKAARALAAKITNTP